MTPFRTSDHASGASNSVGSPSIASSSSVQFDGKLFGDSVCDIDWSLIPSDPDLRAASDHSIGLT